MRWNNRREPDSQTTSMIDPVPALPIAYRLELDFYRVAPYGTCRTRGGVCAMREFDFMDVG